MPLPEYVKRWCPAAMAPWLGEPGQVSLGDMRWWATRASPRKRRYSADHRMLPDVSRRWPRKSLPCRAVVRSCLHATNRARSSLVTTFACVAFCWRCEGYW